MQNTNSYFDDSDEQKQNEEIHINKEGDDILFGEESEDEELNFDSDKIEREGDFSADQEQAEQAEEFGSEEEAEEESDTDDNKSDAEEEGEGIRLSSAKLDLIKKLLQNAKENNDKVIELLSVFGSDETEQATISQIGNEFLGSDNEDKAAPDGNVVEGVFDGENMIGPDGKEYSVPANYASKSKLVEGDILKLTILNNGTFIYKQIGPIDRNRVVGILEKTPSGQFVVSADDKRWKVLTASVTYFKGNVGDEVIILVPKNADSQWAAVDNIVRNKEV